MQFKNIKWGKWTTKVILIIAMVLGLVLFLIKGCPALFISNDVLFSFTITSDSQVDFSDPDLTVQDTKWGVNSKVWTRIVSEVIDRKPAILFFCGDSIDGFTNGNTEKLNTQYAYWRGSIAELLNNNIYVFPVPGNHEMEDGDLYTGNMHATVLNENSWRENMGDLIPDRKLWERCLGVPFAASSWSDVDYAQSDSDGITTDQQKLSYSFDYKGSHFIIINTSAVGHEFHIPLMRLKEDLFDAKRRNVKHIFIFGHYPAFSYKYDAASRPRGLDQDIKARDEFWKLVTEYKAVYFCGHEHLFNASRPANGNAYQIIVGPAGGEFRAKKPVRNPDLGQYTWVNVQVYANGKVHLDAFGFSTIQSKIKVLKCWELENDFQDIH